MLSSVEADQPNVYVHSGLGTGVVDTAPLWPTTIAVPSTWHANRDQTIEFWFKQESNSATSYCVLSVGASAGRRLLIAVSRSNHPSYPGKVSFSFNGASGSVNLYSEKRYDDGQWHHCVIEIYQYGGFTNLYFYFDGQLESHHYRAYPFEFGNWGNTTIGDCERFVPGYVIQGSPIDEIALYDRVIDDERKLAHYNEVMSGPPGPSVAIAGQVDISGAVKTNKLVRLNTAQFDVDGFIRAPILKDPLPFFIASQIGMFGNVKTAMAGKAVAASIRMQSSELAAIVQTGIGIRL